MYSGGFRITEIRWKAIPWYGLYTSPHLLPRLPLLPLEEFPRICYTFLCRAFRYSKARFNGRFRESW
jgi:hypothetical protein